MNENDDEAIEQRKLHDAIETALRDDGTLDGGLVLSGWIIVYETASLDLEVAASAGHFYGPAELTTWRAMGLVEWARMTLRAATEDSDE